MMEIKKYTKLRDKIRSKDFEGKNKSVDTTLFFLSILGNVGSIFFAYFLVNPAFKQAIETNLTSGNAGVFIAGFLTVLVLSSFELIKRKILSNLSFDLVKHNYNITKNFIGWLFFGLALISASFYFSLNGARNFANTSDIKNEKVSELIEVKIDSVNSYYNEQKKSLIEDNESLMDVNKQLRLKIAETPLNYPTTRKGYQDNINSNTETIKQNRNEIDIINNEQEEKISNLESKKIDRLIANQEKDNSNIILFLIISSSIELMIIIGIYFRQYFDYNVYMMNRNELEAVVIKKERYRNLIRYIYKEGELGLGEVIIGKTALKNLLSEKSKINNPKKLVEEFLEDAKYMGILTTNGNRTITSKTYEESMKLLETYDKTIRIIEKLD